MSRAESGCVFCEIAADRAPATVIRRWSDALAIVPLNPVTPGHLLVLPIQHVTSAASAPVVAATTAMHAASLIAQNGYDANLLTSIGPAATQTVFHLHWHIVPRAPDDGLRLPWTPC